MCGIFGFAKQEGNLSEFDLYRLRGLVMDLMLLNETRGRDGIGLAIVSEKETHLFKEAMPATSLILGRKMKEHLARISAKTLLCLGHTRWATVGSVKAGNCHPFATEDFIGIHNGNFLNHEDLIQKSKKKMESDVDSEAIFRILDGSRDMKEMVSRLEEMKGDFAVGFSDRKNPSQLFLLRNKEKPLHIAYIRDMRTLIWSSERTHLEYVLQRGEFHSKVKSLEENYLYLLDTRKFSEKMNFKKVPCRIRMPEASGRHLFGGEMADSYTQQMNLFHYEDLRRMGYLDGTEWENQAKLRCYLCQCETETSDIYFDELSNEFVCSSCSCEHEHISQGNREEEASPMLEGY